MATRPVAADGPSALVLRHLEDVFGAAEPTPSALERFRVADHWFLTLPRPAELPPEAQPLVAHYRALPAPERATLLGLAMRTRTTPSESVAHEVGGFIERMRRGAAEWASPAHRLAVLAGASPADHAGARLDADRPEAAVHGLLADADVPAEALVAAAEGFARADRPSWAVACLVAAAEAADDPAGTARLAARAAVVAAFDGDFRVAAAVLGRFTASDTRVLIRESAPARALRQALVEGDTAAARTTAEMRLRDPAADTDAVGQALVVLALANIIDGDPGGWARFVELCASLGVPLHPDVAAIATAYGLPDLAPPAHLDFPVSSDGRGWTQLAGNLASLLNEYRDMRMGSATPSPDPCTRTANRLVRAVSATWLGVILAHDQRWADLEVATAVALETTETVPIPLMRANAETLLALAEAFRGEQDAAKARIDRIRADPALRRGYRLRIVLDSVEAMVEGAAGRYERALALLSTRDPDALDLTAGPRGPVELFDVVDFALLLHRREEATARLAHAEELLHGLQSERTRFVLDACAAALALHDTLEPTEALLQRAATTPYVYETARLRLVYAERLRRLHRSPDAQRQLVRAEVELQSVEAGAWLDRVRRELRACRREDAVQTATLTEQEARIAELAAVGMSNKEIGARLHLSPRTVGGHLYRIFPKLGIATRAQLRDALTAGSDGA
ncbi:helix-turn-helix transcriptional regulator [Microbacterium sp. GXF7504]